MTYTPAQWRLHVEERLAALRRELAHSEAKSKERERLVYRIGMLEKEVRLLDEDDEQRGTQWFDEETGAAADM